MCSSAALFGLTRTSDPVKFGGQSVSVSGLSMEEVGPHVATKLQQQGAMPPDLLILNPKEGDKMRKALIAKSSYNRAEVKSAVAGISFKGFEIEGPQGTITVLEDITRPVGTGLMTRKGAWKLHTLGACPQILDFDTQEFLRVATDDAYEIRIGMYGNMWTDRPVDSAVLTSVGA